MAEGWTWQSSSPLTCGGPEKSSLSSCRRPRPLFAGSGVPQVFSRDNRPNPPTDKFPACGVFLQRAQKPSTASLVSDDPRESSMTMSSRWGMVSCRRYHIACDIASRKALRDESMIDEVGGARRRADIGRPLVDSENLVRTRNTYWS